MDREQAETVAEALLAPVRQPQREATGRHVRRRWRHEALLWRNRRALRPAVAATVVAMPVAGITGLLPWTDFAGVSGWLRLWLSVGMPAWLYGMWRYRLPPEPARIEEV